MQTKKRAKPVKFGKAAKEPEKKVEFESPEPTVEQPEAHVPQAPQAPQHGGELVDKLSDVPFEADFGTPPAPPAAPVAPSAPEPVQAPTPPAAPAAEEIVHSDNLQATPSAFDSNPEMPNQTIPPIGRANEQIAFSPHDTVFNTPPDGAEKKKNPFLYFLIIAFVAFLTGIGFMAGIYYAMPNKNFFAMFTLPSMPNIPGIQQPSPTPLPVAKPTPSPVEKEVKLSDYTVKVLNGSGISGQAAKVKASLTAEGFTVTSTGNADSSDVLKTQISYKKTVTTSALTKIKDVLKKTYVLDKETETTVAKDADITIIIGKDTAK
jgi:hypothetical protein